MCVCCVIVENPLPGHWTLPVKDINLWTFLGFLHLDISSGFGSLRTSLLCIVGEIAGGGSVAVAVGIGDR